VVAFFAQSNLTILWEFFVFVENNYKMKYFMTTFQKPVGAKN